MIYGIMCVSALALATHVAYTVATAGWQQLIANSVTEDFAQLKKNQGYVVPEGYNVENALQAAVLTLPNVYNIEKATPDSVKKTLFDMVVQGLYPSKTQVKHKLISSSMVINCKCKVHLSERIKC